MNHDPQGYYARLEIDWDAPPDAIHAAYRRKARVLHPDIPLTGDATAFVALKEAYDVLSDPLRRAAYERAARSLDQFRATLHAGAEAHFHPHPRPPPAAPAPRTRGPRLSDLPLGIWIVLALLVVIAAFEALLHINAPAPEQAVDVPATAPTVAPQAPPPPPRPIRLFGTPNVYVIPAGTPAMLLRYDASRHDYVPIGQLPAFSAAQAVRVLRDHGLVEVRLSDSSVGYIDAARLAPGNIVAARQAYCAYNAGPPPANGEVLHRAGAGAGQVRIENTTSESVVMKLRDHAGGSAATVFLAPNGQVTVGSLPGGDYRPEYAMGELWSRACNEFAAGMRSQRFAGFADLSALSVLVIPPDVSGQPPPVDIPDQEFEHE